MLDSHKTYAAYDPDDVGFHVEHLPEQVRVAWREARNFTLPARYKNIRRVVVAAQGSSGRAAEFVVQAFAKKLTVSVDVVAERTLPLWTDRDTLVVLSSFSGMNEDVCAVIADAKKRHCKIAVCTGGGVLGDMARDAHFPTIRFTPGDLGKEARFALGFSSMGVLGILRAAGLCSVKDDDVRGMHNAMGDVLDTCAVDVPTKDNPAKTVATALRGRTVLVIGAEHLACNGDMFAQQLHETAKQFAVAFPVPRTSHRFLEAFSFPKHCARNMTVVMLRSARYSADVVRSLDAIADVLESAGMEIVDYVAGGKKSTEECAEVLQFSSFVAYYTAMLNAINPHALPFVAAFKKRLSP